MRTNLRWEAEGKSFWAYSGELIVGMILQPSHDNAEGKWLWTIDAVWNKDGECCEPDLALDWKTAK